MLLENEGYGRWIVELNLSTEGWKKNESRWRDDPHYYNTARFDNNWCNTVDEYLFIFKSQGIHSFWALIRLSSGYKVDIFPYNG